MKPAQSVLDYEEAEHKYTLDGRVLPSVTQILKPLECFDAIPQHRLEAAREFGQHVHLACHLYAEGELDEVTIDDRVGAYLDGYRNFFIDTKSISILSEIRVASAQYGYAGTVDTVVRLHRKEDVLLDIKTSATVPRSVGPQCSAYKEALREFIGLKLKKRFCLHLNPSHCRGYKLFELQTSASRDWNIFLSSLNIFRWHAEK